MEHGQVLECGGGGKLYTLAHQVEEITCGLFAAEYFMLSGPLEAFSLHNKRSVLNSCSALFAVLWW